MRKSKLALAAIGSLVVAIAISACGDSDNGSSATTGTSTAGGSSTTEAPANSNLPQGSEAVTLDPAEFTTKIDNPHWPMSPGSRWVYRETETNGHITDVVVEVRPETKMIANGIEAVVVRDTAREDGIAIEVTDDWYAQDSAGNIWYLGEETAEYENGKVASRAGSFEAGVDGAQAGIALPGNPESGLSYRQEYDKGNAEDMGAVVTVGQEQVQVPFGYFPDDVVMTRDLVPLEPKVQELKFYAPGIGPVLSVHLDGLGGRSELISYTPGS